MLVWTEVPDPDAYSVRLTRISAGYGHTCGHDLDGKLYCWGDNRYGQLGDGTNTDRLTPVAVQVPAGVMLSGVSAGADHTCADGSDGQVYCWGSNAYGQLGDGTKTGRDTPVAVQAPEGVVLSGVSAGYLHTCANGSDGSVYCWGHNSDGQLGDGTTTASPIPLAVPAPAAEVTHSEVSAGRFHTCAHGSDGNVYCWGNNGSGQLGDGTTTNRWTPVAVKALEGVTLSGVSVGAFHTCADGSDGQVYCWGANRYGQLGDGTNTSRDMPVPVQAPEGVVLSGVSVGHRHACAIDPNGELFCWGYNYYGQLGDGTRINRLTPVAVQVPTAHTTLTVSAGNYHACGLSVAGPAYCWGTIIRPARRREDGHQHPPRHRRGYALSAAR